MPGCKTTIFASITGEVGAPANSQFRVNSFLPTLYWYVDQDVIGIGIENDIDSGIGPSLAAHRSLWGIQLCPPRQSDRMSDFAPWTCIICLVINIVRVSGLRRQRFCSNLIRLQTFRNLVWLLFCHLNPLQADPWLCLWLQRAAHWSKSPRDQLWQIDKSKRLKERFGAVCPLVSPYFRYVFKSCILGREGQSQR